MPAKGKGRGSKKTAEKTQENVVDSTTSQKVEKTEEIATATPEINALNKKSNASKRKQNKKDSAENGDVEAEAPVVPEKRGRGRPAANSAKTEQPAPPTSVSPVNKQELEVPNEKAQTKGKRGAKKGSASATAAVVSESDTKKKDESKQQQESESEEIKAAAVTVLEESDKPTQAKRGRKKAAAAASSENENDTKKTESPPIESQKDAVVKGGKRGTAAATKKEKAKEEQQATNGDVEKISEQSTKKGRPAKPKKEVENGVNEDGKKSVKNVAAKKITSGGRGRKRAAIDTQENEQNGTVEVQ